MDTGLTNAMNKTTPQSKAILDGFHVNKNQQVHVWINVCETGRRDEFDRMNNDVYRLRQSKSWHAYYEMFKYLYMEFYNGIDVIGDLPE